MSHLLEVKELTTAFAGDFSSGFRQCCKRRKFSFITADLLSGRPLPARRLFPRFLYSMSAKVSGGHSNKAFGCAGVVKRNCCWIAESSGIKAADYRSLSEKKSVQNQRSSVRPDICSTDLRHDFSGDSAAKKNGLERWKNNSIYT